MPKASGDSGSEVIKAREFDITQYGKKLTVLIAVLVPAIVAALKALGVKEISETMVIASLAVTAIAVFCATLLMAVDMLSRALVTRQPKPTSPPAKASGANDDDELDPDTVRVEKTTETRLSRA
ncbi:MAG TPA: hypothetical protein VFM94_09605 [Solirubrobacterales bacterium]|nr:hypothetical protein [Solirubrobacterales bacterium]